MADVEAVAESPSPLLGPAAVEAEGSDASPPCSALLRWGVGAGEGVGAGAGAGAAADAEWTVEQGRSGARRPPPSLAFGLPSATLAAAGRARPTQTQVQLYRRRRRRRRSEWSSSSLCAARAGAAAARSGGRRSGVPRWWAANGGGGGVDGRREGEGEREKGKGQRKGRGRQSAGRM